MKLYLMVEVDPPGDGCGWEFVENGKIAIDEALLTRWIDDDSFFLFHQPDLSSAALEKELRESYEALMKELES